MTKLSQIFRGGGGDPLLNFLQDGYRFPKSYKRVHQQIK